MLKNLLLLILSIIPSFILLMYIYKKDKIEKEPKHLLLLLFVVGIAAALASFEVSMIFKQIFPFLKYDYSNLNIYQILFKTLITIALVEELTKWLMNYFITWKSSEFNYQYDAIVYSVFISLGFATYENILYSFAYGSFGFMPSILRGIISIPGHAIFGVFTGYYLGISLKEKLNKHISKSYKYKFYSIIIPILLHFLYNFLLIKKDAITTTLFIIYIITIYICAYIKIKKLSNIKKKLK